MRKYRHIIITHSPEECYQAITDINHDDKTNYTDRLFIAGKNFEIKHMVETDHNTLNFKRTFNTYEIQL